MILIQVYENYVINRKFIICKVNYLDYIKNVEYKNIFYLV